MPWPKKGRRFLCILGRTNGNAIQVLIVIRLLADFVRIAAAFRSKRSCKLNRSCFRNS